MPLPILHSFAGYSIYRLAKRREEKPDWKFALYCMVLANLADLDFVPGIFCNNPNLFHRGCSHSLGAALVCAIFAALYTYVIPAKAGIQSPNPWIPTSAGMTKKGKREGFKIFCLSLGAYYSHVVLDYFGGTSRPIPLFWPFNQTEYHWPVTFLNSIPGKQGLEGTFGFVLSFMSFPVFTRLILEASIVLFIFNLNGFVRRLRRAQIEPVPAVFSLGLAFLFFMTAVAVKAVAG